MQVFVRDNDVNSALRVLKKKMQREGTFREMKRRRSYEKPSERRAREKAEAVRRTRKGVRTRMELLEADAAKTARLKELRLAKEAADTQAALTAKDATKVAAKGSVKLAR